MADYATKRVPLEPDDESPQGNGEELRGAPAPHGDESLEELRHLIIAPEQADLARLQERLDSPEQRTRDVSEVLPEAMLRRLQ